MKRILVALILFSMVLHSASRLGVLSYLYQQRREIAYAVGIIAEIPIAMCSSDYDLNSGLSIVSADKSDLSTPPALIEAKEIQLFFSRHLSFNNPNRSESKINEVFLIEAKYSSPPLSIFHPPS